MGWFEATRNGGYTIVLQPNERKPQGDTGLGRLGEPIDQWLAAYTKYNDQLDSFVRQNLGKPYGECYGGVFV